MTEKNLIKTFIYKEELELLERYTSCKISTVKKINEMIEDKLTKKPNIKRFNIVYVEIFQLIHLIINYVKSKRPMPLKIR